MIQDDRLTASSSPAKSFGFSTPASVWLIMLVALLFTCLGWYLFNQYAEQRGRERFEYQAMLVKDAIRDRLLTYEQVLRGGVGLFMASDGVTREEWHEYVTNAKMESFYPGIQGIGYSVILHPEQLAAHEEAIRAEALMSIGCTRPASATLIRPSSIWNLSIGVIGGHLAMTCIPSRLAVKR